MNKKSVKLVLSLIAIVSAIIICNFSAGAFLTGDVTNDGGITADDARLILRAAVKLENLSEEQMKIADVNDDGTITANDARIVLRMSVNLEEKTHYYEKEILSPATCTENGKMKLTCTECDDVYEKDIDALGHDWNIEKVTCTEDRYCKRTDCPTKERINKLGHTKDWGVCDNCNIFITEKYAEQAATIKTKFNEAKTAFDAAYEINSYNAMLDGVSYHTLPNTKAALPNYKKAKTACEAALAACGDIPEFAAIKALLEKNIYNLTISIEEANKIITFCNGNSAKIDANNYDTMVEKLETYNAGFWNNDYKDHTLGNNKKLEKEIVW